MKKILAILAALALIAALAACGGDTQPNPNGGGDTAVTDNVDPTENAVTDGGDTTGDAAPLSMDDYIGGWYGWWAIFEPTGDVGDLQDGDWFDCCADIEAYDEEIASMVIWDELSSRSEPIAILDLYFDEDGTAHSLNTSAFMDDTLENDELFFNLNDATYDDMLYIDGEYSSDTASFKYIFILRPWGYLWDDIEADSPEDLPYGYYDWYLPLLEGGNDVPDTIDLEY